MKRGRMRREREVEVVMGDRSYLVSFERVSRSIDILAQVMRWLAWYLDSIPTYFMSRKQVALALVVFLLVAVAVVNV
jgi:hypothetical protein